MRIENLEKYGHAPRHRMRCALIERPSDRGLGGPYGRGDEQQRDPGESDARDGERERADRSTGRCTLREGSVKGRRFTVFIHSSSVKSLALYHPPRPNVHHTHTHTHTLLARHTSLVQSKTATHTCGRWCRCKGIKIVPRKSARSMHARPQTEAAASARLLRGGNRLRRRLGDRLGSGGRGLLGRR